MEMFERNQEMWTLRHVKGWKLKDIGFKYGISRERVRQCIGNTGSTFRTEWTEKLIASGKAPEISHWTELDSAPGVKKAWKKDWGNHRHKAYSGNVGMAQRFEEFASEILCRAGIENELMPNRHSYDIKTDSGIRIDVKITNVDVSKFANQNNVYPTFQLPEMKSGRDCDFFFVFIPDSTEVGEYTYFVIPSFEFYNRARGSRARIPWPALSPKPSKWHKYHKRLDLLS